jgi:hypothetical protein
MNAERRISPPVQIYRLGDELDVDSFFSEGAEDFAR